MSRRVSAPLAAVLALAGSLACSSEPVTACPGAVVAGLTFGSASGAALVVPRIHAGDAAIAALDPVPAIPDCPFPADGAPFAYPATLPAFAATLAFDTTTRTAALCRAGHDTLYGQRDGARYALEASTGGAVLSTCGARCTATLRALVVGDVARDAGGAVTGFVGGLFEVLTPEAGSSCGTCFAGAAAACAARYLLEGTP